VLGRYIRLRSTGAVMIEAAQANGVVHIQEREQDPLHGDTAGVGELILDAAALAPPRMIIGVGGSATNDGGAGMARALGATFFDMAGNRLPPGGAALADLARIDWQHPAALAGIDFVVATDVTNPLVGSNGASRVYGPQKGASPADVEALEAALVRYAAVVRRSLGVDIATVPGGGAAGGLGAGLVAFLGARIESGFEVVAAAAGLPERLAAADYVLTGEGRFDSQSLQGKVTGRILKMARDAGKPAVVFAGSAEGDSGHVVSLAALEPDPGASMRRAAELLAEAAARWAEHELR
jgi:glycerate kinase